MLNMELTQKRLKVQIFFKFFLDIFFSVSLLIALFPLIFVISVLIKIDDEGGVFFKQSRLGKNGKVFKIIKFRTMIINADDYLDTKGVPVKDRVTKIGKILRTTSLDEIPQLFNIILGQMSFIGPRPTLVSHWNRYTKEQKKRSKMLPGITGWAQVCGRNEIPWSKRIELDIEYIDNFSLWFDVVIAFKTIYIIFRRKDISMDRNTLSVDDLGGEKNEK
jgi:undecaprenyl phosphate N,N'-diacetylbacillosamine 1-phosphate transferase